jgi:hypothetical protein
MLSAVSAKPESCFRLPLQITFKPLHGRCAGDTLCTAVAQEKQSFLLSPEGSMFVIGSNWLPAMPAYR